MEIKEYSHPDSIWTWKSNNRKHKVSLWLPYFQSVEPIKGKKDGYRFVYNGGEVELRLKQLDSILIYGASGTLSVDFLDKLSWYRIPLIIHRRNMPRPYCFLPATGIDEHDVITNQILTRENGIRQVYIARTLIEARFRSMSSWVPISGTAYQKLRKARTIDGVRNIEAQVSRRFWKCFFEKLGTPDLVRRQKDNPVTQALDAASFFLAGIILRWILFHRLSPAHGYLHVNTTYMALVYDLMEPYRYLMEKALAMSAETKDSEDHSKLTALTIEGLKKELERPVYVPSTRQTVRQKNLLHGIVLALRSYLMKETKRFVIPVEGERKGGRPPKVSYRMPGQI